MMDVSELCYSFVEDVSKCTKQMDIQNLLGLFSIYLDAVSSTETQLSATPKLSSLLHTYYLKNHKKLQLVSCCRIHVHPTAISQRREGTPRGSKMASSGRPVKQLHPDLIVWCKVKVVKRIGFEDSDCLMVRNNSNKSHHF